MAPVGMAQAQALGNQRGIALPLTIFVVTVMTILLAAAFAQVSAERRLAAGSSDAIAALTVAQSGLDRYLAYRNSLRLRPADGDSQRINLVGGYADVVARVVQRPPADTLEPWTYLIRSTGSVILPALGARVQARRTVAQFAQWQVGRMRQIAAFEAANGLRDQNPATGVRIVGDDYCNARPAIASVRAASGSSLSRGSYSPAPVIGGSGTQLADTIGVDWARIVSGGFEPDYRTLRLREWAYKSVLIQGDATLAAGSGSIWGNGLLIVTGDLTTTGNGAVFWYGIVLVGGEIVFNARHTHFYGLVISGLNHALPGPPPRAGQLGGTAGRRYHVDYASCYVEPTLARLTGFAPVRNGWMDNWAEY